VRVAWVLLKAAMAKLFRLRQQSFRETSAYSRVHYTTGMVAIPNTATKALFSSLPDEVGTVLVPPSGPSGI
jgi:hypothetical protein